MKLRRLNLDVTGSKITRFCCVFQRDVLPGRFAFFMSTARQLEQLQEAQKNRIVQMLLKGDIYGLPGSEGTVRRSCHIRHPP